MWIRVLFCHFVTNFYEDYMNFVKADNFVLECTQYASQRDTNWRKFVTCEHCECCEMGVAMKMIWIFITDFYKNRKNRKSSE